MCLQQLHCNGSFQKKKINLSDTWRFFLKKNDTTPHQKNEFMLPWKNITTLNPFLAIQVCSYLFILIFLCVFICLTDRGQKLPIFGSTACHVSARGALHCAPAKRRRVWMLRSSWGDACPSNATELSKFQVEKLGVFRSGMDHSIARICCVVLTLLAGKFDSTEPLKYFNSLLQRRRGR